MQYIKTDRPVQAAADHLATVIKAHLAAGERVVWLLSGGSGIKVGLETADQLKGIDLTNLAVTLTDERYGPLGHSDENWQQLLDQGLSLGKATLFRPLNGTDRTGTVKGFDAWIKQQLTAADFSVGLLGIGSDGHAAGIKPHSSAVTATTYAHAYDGDDFERITITPRAIMQLDEAVVQATGSDKQATLHQLLHTNTPVAEQPAQILKQLAQTTIYSDNEG